MTTPLKWYHLQKDIIKGVIVFLLNLIIAALIFWIAFKQMGGVAYRSMQPYFDTDKSLNKYINLFERPKCLEVKYYNTFKEYQKIMNLRKSHHLHVSIIFFRNYYGVLLMLMLLSCTGGIVLFILINKGWANAGIELQSFFLSLVFCVAFFGLFPSVFKQEENYSKNLVQYMAYTKAELNVVRQFSYLSSHCNTINTDSSIYSYNQKVDSLININTIELNRLTNHILNFDATKIKSMGEVSNMIQEMLNKTDTARQ